MADKKISELTGATTPLAGTEVVPLVQSSTTKKVSVADLTAGRTVSVSGLTVSGGTASRVAYLDGSKNLTTSDAFRYNGTNSLQLLTTTPTVQITDTSASRRASLEFNTDGGAWSFDGGNDLWIKYGSAGSTPTSGSYVYLSRLTGVLALGVNAANRVTIDSSGNTSVLTGNVVMSTAGKGIDFSANPNPAGMTSELLNDYEEGTWTIGLTFGGASTGVVISAQDAYYTKIGRLVHVSGRFSLSSKGSATGTASITGLPFTPAGSYATLAGGSVAWYVNMSGVNGLTTFGNLSATTLLLNIPGTAAITNAADTNFTDTSAMYFTYTYVV